jgi:hypothetical protein
MIKKLLTSLALAVATLSASAAPVVTSGSLTRGAFEFSPTVTGTVQVGSNTIGAIYIGGMQATFQPASGSSDSFLMFCVDLYSPAAGQGLGVQYDKTDYVTELSPWDKMGQLFTANDGAGSGDASGSAAMQLAIWNTLYDTDLDVSTGNFNVINVTGTDVVARANGLLQNGAVTTSLYDVSYLSDFEYSTALSKASKQDFITATVNSGGGCSTFNGCDVSLVPEPTSLALALFGLVGVGAARRARKA